MTERILNVFLLEDQPADLKLVKWAVRKYAPKSIFTVANNRASFLEKIEWLTPDVILADYNLPDYNGLQALLVVKEKLPHVPFIFITGTLNDEEQVAEAVLSGASGYLLKDNLKGLPEKLEEILKISADNFAKIEAQEKQARRKQVLLQKVAALVDQAENFDQKVAIKVALKELLEMKC